MALTLDWLGVSTFRVKVDDLVIFLDAYMDRVPDAPPVGLSAVDVDRADFVLVGHSHFDHLWGAEKIALNTGATVVGSYESVRVMHKEGVPEDQLLVVGGGEKVRLSDRVTVRVFPSLHACTWARTGGVEEECLGDMGLTLQERHERMAAVGLGPSGQFEHGKPSRHTGGKSDDRPGIAELRAHLRESDQQPRGDGGALAYLIETPEGSVLWKDTSGHWTGILRDLRPDVAILGAGGRGNIDGEPVQGSLAQFLAREVDLLRPGRVVLCHHDNWMPPVTSETDVEPIRAELARNFPQVVQVEMGYMEDYPILRGD